MLSDFMAAKRGSMMKRVKIGATIVFLVVAIYFTISYGIFWFTKPSADAQLKFSESPSVEQNIAEPKLLPHESVVIQNMQESVCKHASCKNQGQLYPELDDSLADFIVTNDEDAPLAQVVAEEQPLFVMNADTMQDKKILAVDAYGFIKMPKELLLHGYQIDQDTRDVIKILVGNDLDEFVRLILQSNNNIVSKDACRSCGMHAFFKKVIKDEPLDTDEIVILQQALANLSKFVEKMRSLSPHTAIMRAEQYSALQDLNKSQIVKNNLKIQARKASTTAALKKLQAIKYNR